MRFVLDSNVLISAMLTRDGAPGELLGRWLAGEFEAVASEALLAELGGVLLRDKFRPYVDVREAEAFVALVRASAVMVDVPARPTGLSPDPGDHYLVALAMGGHGDALVTGDRALQGVRIEGLAIFTPVEALGKLDAVDQSSADH